MLNRLDLSRLGLSSVGLRPVPEPVGLSRLACKPAGPVPAGPGAGWDLSRLDPAWLASDQNLFRLDLKPASGWTSFKSYMKVT